MRLHRASFCRATICYAPPLGALVATVARIVYMTALLRFESLDTMSTVLCCKEKLRCLNRVFMVVLPTMA